jgi:hypothetical protein
MSSPTYEIIKLLWSHCRNINVNVFKHKIVYEIPIYDEIISRDYKYELDKSSSCFRLTIIKPSERLLK